MTLLFYYDDFNKSLILMADTHTSNVKHSQAIMSVVVSVVSRWYDENIHSVIRSIMCY